MSYFSDIQRNLSIVPHKGEVGPDGQQFFLPLYSTLLHLYPNYRKITPLCQEKI